MIITKRVLVNSVLSESRTADDYVSNGGLFQSDVHTMDNEFYTDATERVWIMVQRIINQYIRAGDHKRNEWMFQNDLNRETMEYFNHHWKNITVNSVRARFKDAQVYSLMQQEKIQSEQDIVEFASWLIAESLPKL